MSNDINWTDLGIQTAQTPSHASAHASKGHSDDPQDAFLTLFLAQLKHQNPMDPQDSGEFLSQIAQFNTVSGIQKLNSSFEGFAQQISAQKALEATALVGHKVEVPASFGILGDGLQSAQELTGTIVLPVHTNHVSVSVETPQGVSVKKMDLGSLPAGTNRLTWDGQNESGDPMPPGAYAIKAHGMVGGKMVQLETRMDFPVKSVTLPGAGGNGILVNLGQYPEISGDTEEFAVPMQQISKVWA